jgi:hypothetical protein
LKNKDSYKESGCKAYMLWAAGLIGLEQVNPATSFVRLFELDAILVINCIIDHSKIIIIIIITIIISTMLFYIQDKP